MNKSIVAFLLVAMSASMFFAPAVSSSAAVVGTLNYSLSQTTVSMAADGTGSFTIYVPALLSPYAGVQFIAKLPDGAEITSVSYGFPGGSVEDLIAIDPTSPPTDEVKETKYFSCFATSNILTAELSCTVHLRYSGAGEAALEILEIKQYRIRANDTDELVTDGTKSITLVPYGTRPSSDASLSGLSLSRGALSPEFHPDVTVYTAVVPYSADSVEVEATARHPGAKVEGDGAAPLVVGTNTVVVTVTAEDGEAMKLYAIVIAREAWPGGQDPGPGTDPDDGTRPGGPQALQAQALALARVRALAQVPTPFKAPRQAPSLAPTPIFPMGRRLAARPALAAAARLLQMASASPPRS